MSSGGDDAPSYDPYDEYEGYGSYETPSDGDGDGDGDGEDRPWDDLHFVQDDENRVKSEESYETDIFPKEFSLPCALKHLGGTIGGLIMESFDYLERSRILVNQLYRTDSILMYDFHLDSVWELKNDIFKSLCAIRQPYQEILNKLGRLGGPYYAPSDNLWQYLHFFWFGNGYDAISSSCTPKPEGMPRPSVHHAFCVPSGCIEDIMVALEAEEFTIPPEVDQGGNNVAMLGIYKAMSLKAQQYWRSRSKDLQCALTVSVITTGLYGELMEMKEQAKQMVSTLRTPPLLSNALYFLGKLQC